MTRKMNLSACAMMALAGSTLSAMGNDWAAPVDGLWSDMVNWVGGVPDVDTEDAVLGLSGDYLVELNFNYTINSLMITNIGATLNIDSNRTLGMDSGMLNHGTVFVNPQGLASNAFLSFVADGTITGNGSILLNALNEPGDATILPNTFIVTQDVNHLIHGAGRIQGNFINNGTVLADNPAGAGLELAGTFTQGASGTAGADNATLLLGNNSVTSGGELTSVNGGLIRVTNGTATIHDITNSGTVNILGGSDTLAMTGDVTNDGTIVVNSDEAVFNAHLRFDAAATLGGSGEVQMKSLGDFSDAQIFTSGAFNGTIGASQTVSGSGLVDGRSGGAIVNLGTITGTDPAVSMAIDGVHFGTGGEYRADGGTLSLRNGLDLTGGTFHTSAGGAIIKNDNGTSTISGITNNGDMDLSGGGGSVRLGDSITNNGTITVNSNSSVFNMTIVSAVDATIDGNGTIDMISLGDINDARIRAEDFATLTIGADQTVQGAGRVEGATDGVVVNLGTINGNFAAVGKDPLQELRLTGEHAGNGVGIYRSDDGLLGLGNGLVLDGGNFDSSGTGIVEVTGNGTATISNCTNAGDLGIRGGGGTLAMAGPLVNNGTLYVNSNMNIFNATLQFADPSAAISGNGTIRMQAIAELGDAQVRIADAFDAVIGADQTIAGSGQIRGNNDGTIVNNGTFIADDPAWELRLHGNHDGSGGGVYRGDNGFLGMAGATSVVGGTFDSSGTGAVGMTVGGVSDISDVTNEGDFDIFGNGTTIQIAGPVVNNGTITINADTNIFNAVLSFVTDTSIAGTGTIHLINAGNSNDAQLQAAAGFTGTIGSGQMVTGDGQIDNTIQMNGVIDPSGTTREFQIDDLSIGSTGGMVADLGGLLVGEFDRLVLGGGDTINLDGTLTVQIDDGYVPMFLDTWDIIDGGTVNGEFADHIFPPSPAGLEYKVIYESSRVYVVLTCAADLTGDGDLNFLDVSAFLGFYGDADVRGDINGDGNFNFLDVSLFLQIFSGTCGGA